MILIIAENIVNLIKKAVQNKMNCFFKIILIVLFLLRNFEVLIL